MVKAGVVLLAALLSVSCGSSPTEPDTQPPPGSVPVSNPLAETGTWVGFYRVDACTAVPAPCYRTSADRPVAFMLRTSASGSSLEGVFDSELQDAPVALSGTLQADGSATLAGTLMTVPPGRVYPRVRVSNLTVRSDPTSGLSGTLTLRMESSYVELVTATILSASMEPFAVIPQREFQGTWEGFGQVSSCSGDCWFYSPGQIVPLTIRFTQRGAEVSGELFEVPATGTVSNGELSLAGELRETLEEGDSGFTLRRFETFSATVDAVGRMRGRFSVAVRGMKRVPRTVEPFAGVTSIELISIARRF